MPTLAQIRTAIDTTLTGVTNIGVVHDFERYAKNMAEFRALYEATIGGAKQIRGWMVRRLSRRAISPDLGRTIVTNTWQIRGYLQLDDANASEKTFDNLVEAVVDAFKADETLGGVVDCIIVDDVAGLQLEDSGPVMFGGVLCHSARCRLLTRHFE